MIRPFGLNDISLVQQLQRSRAALAIEHTLTHPRDPLWIALTAPWPWAGAGVATYVLRDRQEGHSVAGFVQLMERTTRPEADILHLAPLMTTDAANDEDSTAIWCGLLTHCSTAASTHGLHRIFASTPEGGLEEACLKASGYSLYTRERVYKLVGLPGTAGGRAGFRPQLPQDSWALQRIYTRVTPKLVQQAEGAQTGEVGSPALSWWEPDRWHGFVWDPAGEVRGAVQVHVGRAGHWLRIWGTNSLTAKELRMLVEQGLQLVSMLPARRLRGCVPVYATVRDYEIGLSGALTGFGFAPFAERARFVRHTSAIVRDCATASVPVVDSYREVAVRSQAGRSLLARKVDLARLAGYTNAVSEGASAPCVGEVD